MANITSKPWWESSTIWINLAGIVALVLEVVISSNLVPDPEIIGLIVAILNIINRFRAPKTIKTLSIN